MMINDNEAPVSAVGLGTLSSLSELRKTVTTRSELLREIGPVLQKTHRCSFSISLSLPPTPLFAHVGRGEKIETRHRAGSNN